MRETEARKGEVTCARPHSGFLVLHPGCGHIRKSHLLIPRISFPCHTFQFLPLLSQQFWKQKLWVEEENGKTATCPGLGFGGAFAPGFGNKIWMELKQAAGETWPSLTPDSRLSGLLPRSPTPLLPRGCNEWTVRWPGARKTGIKSSSHPRAALGKSPGLSQSLRSNEEGYNSLPGLLGDEFSFNVNKETGAWR